MKHPAIIVVLSCLCATTCTTPAKRINIHTNATACSTCHREKSAATHEVTAALIKDPITLCTACHPTRGQDHRMDIVPARPLPPSLPLSAGGRIVCQTCHDPHGKSKERAYLRMEANALCIACHPDK